MAHHPVLAVIANATALAAGVETGGVAGARAEKGADRRAEVVENPAVLLGICGQVTFLQTSRSGRFASCLNRMAEVRKPASHDVPHDNVIVCSKQLLEWLL